MSSEGLSVMYWLPFNCAFHVLILCQHTLHSRGWGSNQSLCWSLGLGVGEHTSHRPFYPLRTSYVQMEHRLQERTSVLLVLPLLCIGHCVHSCSQVLLPLVLVLLPLNLVEPTARISVSHFPSGKGAHLPLDNWVLLSRPVVIGPMDKCSMKARFNAWRGLPACCSLPIHSLSDAGLLE